MITVIGSLKGGSGKSTLAFNLGLWLLQSGRGAWVYDLDPQATLRDAAKVRREEKCEPPLRVETAPDAPEDLHRDLEQIGDDANILLDVGTSDMAALERAIALSDRVVVPVPPSQADVWSLQRFLGMVVNISRDHGRDRPAVLCFINRADTHVAVRESDETEAALRQLESIRFVPCRLGQRTLFRRSFSEGLAVFELDPGGKGSVEFVRLANALYPN